MIYFTPYFIEKSNRIDLFPEDIDSDLPRATVRKDSYFSKVVSDGWLDITVPKFTKDKIEETLSKIMGNPVTVEELAV